MQLVGEAEQWLHAAWFQMAGWNWLVIMSVVGCGAAAFALLAALVSWRRRRRLARLLDAKVDRETEVLKQELRRRLSEPPQLFDDHLNGAPILGAREAFESDITAAAASVLREAGGERRRARAILRERLKREGSEGKKTLNGTEAHYWRQLGALALVDGSRDAIAAYRRAADLAPDDPESQHLIGVLQLRAGNLAAAETAFRREIELARGSNMTMVRYRGRTMLGDVCAARHAEDEALQVYLEAKSEIDELLLTQPDDVTLNRDLSVTLDRIGDIHTTRGDLAEALASYQQALAIAESLARSAGKTNPEHLHDLSVSYERIGDLLDKKGDLAGALQHFNKGLAISKVLVRGNPDNRAWAWDLAASYERAADALHALGKVDQALRKYRMGLEIAEHLLGSGIVDPSAQRDLAVSYHKIGTLEAMRGNEVEARDLLEKGRNIIAGLDRIAAHRAQWRSDLSKFDAALKTLH
ncbi:MAG: tetratricopeptide repeat protein [Hyphomicrobiales bacterium]|nr:MAG: tetratricopeptide repeat protein [Hyphomicrobiales bacterium]